MGKAPPLSTAGAPDLMSAPTWETVLSPAAVWASTPLIGPVGAGPIPLGSIREQPSPFTARDVYRAEAPRLVWNLLVSYCLHEIGSLHVICCVLGCGIKWMLVSCGFSEIVQRLHLLASVRNAYPL